jgi:hypothetical protein
MILASALLVYLEIWALLTTGYTIGLLQTLFRCKRPVTDAELAASYRHGGIGMHHAGPHRRDDIGAARAPTG